MLQVTYEVFKTLTLTLSKIDAPRSMTMLLKSFLASTSNYNENTNAKPLARTLNEKAQIEFQCTIKMN